MLAVGSSMLHKKKKFRYELLFESKKRNSQEKITKHHKNYSIFAGIGRLHVIIKVVTNLMMRILKKSLERVWLEPSSARTTHKSCRLTTD